MVALITISSLLFFGNKTLLLLGNKINKRIGWLLGSTGAILFIIYFFLIGTPILSILEIGLTVLMTYRFIAKEKVNKKIENYLGILTGVFIIVLTIIMAKGTLTYSQFLGAFGMLVGTYFIISAEQINLLSTKERVGWLLYGFGHFFTSYIGYQKHEWVFFIFQAWQMLLCIAGFLGKNSKNRKLFTYISLILGSIASLIFSIVIIKN